jgi:hypothetical protein
LSTQRRHRRAIGPWKRWSSVPFALPENGSAEPFSTDGVDAVTIRE